MNKVFYIKEYLLSGDTDSAAVERCLEAAKESVGEKTVVFDGKDFRLDRAVLVPSDTEIIIDNCTIKQNDYVFDNIFRGDNLIISGIDPYGTPIDVKSLKNIRIKGIGDAVITGTDKPKTGYHPFFNNYQLMVGDFWGWRTHMFSFSDCQGFELSGLKLRQTMGWAISFDNCQNVHVQDLDIVSCVKNGDGIDFRSGCNHCTVENITGSTWDDTVACTALSRGKMYRDPSKYLSTAEPYNSSHENIDGSIHHIKINNVRTGGRQHGIICLSAWGNKIHNVEITNVEEVGEGDREATVKIYTGYGDGYNKGDIYDISVKNVVSNFSKYAVMVDCEPENLTLESITQNNPEGELYFNM